ncbi:nuclear transport factor 2 family protein [Amycolatopsis sp. Hca4]|uniref:nuclear transport factor 2 family protein n=1 Tax=Amycolatopsis sp. Hca4 TaxID=2742131 RepID=UPI001590A011|nr:nuclear transport factor 2 family protein [Amycolatopsis sp. Hca4]QKV74050.1 ester cyclase [Amycolatopsis sp. Hca4]
MAVPFILSVAMIAAFGPAATAAPRHHQPSAFESVASPKEQANRAVVLSFYAALNRGNLGYFDQVVRPDLVQHYPAIADGRSAFRAYHAALRKQNPDLRFVVERTIAQNDLVVVHSHFTGKPGDAGIAKVNLFRLDRGRIAEHWELNQAVQPAATGNDMFSTLSSPRIARSLPLSTDAESARVGRAAFAEIVNQPDDALRLRALNRYIGNNTYYQHFPNVPNGPEALQQFVHNAFAAQPEYRADVKTVVAEGDLVAVFEHLVKLFDMEDGVGADLFRVRDGKLLEHWVVIEPTPPTSANPHPMY